MDHHLLYVYYYAITMDFQMLGNLNIDTCNRKKLLLSSTVFNPIVINHPNIDFGCLIIKITQLLEVIGIIY